MKRSIFYQLGADSNHDFEAVATEIELAERLGAETVWCLPSVGEGADASVAGTAIWLAGWAERSRKIRLGWGIGGLLPPNRPPIRIAEQAATIDLASEGRLEVLLIPEGDLDGEVAVESWDEGFRMLVDMWDEPTFSWTSERFEVKPIDIVPKPSQKPHPAIALAGWNEGHARSAGRAGCGYLDVSGVVDEGLEIHRDAYREGRAEVDPHALVSIERFAAAFDLDPGEDALERLVGFEQLGVDEVVYRVSGLERGHEQAVERIRFLVDAQSVVH